MEQEFVKQRAMMLIREGLAHQMRGEFEDAVALFSKSIDLYPTAEGYTYRGWAYQLMGRIDDAIEECKRAIEVDPEFGNPYNDIGAYLIAKQRFDDAIPWLERAKRAQRYEPRHYPYMNLGRIYAATGMLQQAITEFEGALRIVPDEPTCVAMVARLRAILN